MLCLGLALIEELVLFLGPLELLFVTLDFEEVALGTVLVLELLVLFAKAFGRGGAVIVVPKEPPEQIQLPLPY